MKKVLVICCLVGIAYHSAADTFYTRSTGVWAAHIWGNTTTGAGGALPTLADGDVIYIDDDITLEAAGFTTSAKITIIINASFSITGQLKVGAGSVFQFPSSAGKIIPIGPGNSEKIFIGTGPSEWTGDNGIITGPGSFPDGWTCCALPIKLLFFQADRIADIVVLSWATTMEEDFSNFVIQRSSDGLTFEDIGELPGKGFNIYDIETKYSFKDTEPMQGFNYYRLKAVDLDDSFEYFGVKAVNISAPKKMTIYPNPTSGSEISFRTNFSPQESDRIILTDQLGNEVYNSPVASSTNALTFKNELRPGMYVLRYISKNFEQVSRVVIKN